MLWVGTVTTRLRGFKNNSKFAVVSVLEVHEALVRLLCAFARHFQALTSL